jgi:hypothetical protein
VGEALHELSDHLACQIMYGVTGSRWPPEPSERRCPRVEELQRVVEQLFPLRGSALRAKHYFRQRCHGDVTLTHKPGPKQEGSQQTKSVPLTEGFAAGANDISVNG